MCYAPCSRDAFFLSQSSLLINVILSIDMSDLLKTALWSGNWVRLREEKWIFTRD